MITLNGENLEIDQIIDIALKNQKIDIASETLVMLNAGFHFLNNFASDRYIYGINTGFGPMAQVKIETANLIELQYNLIRSHAAGFGPYLNVAESKAVLVARLNSLVKGYSGVNPDLIRLMVEMCNRNIIPPIPTHGGVGASGDLIQLAHIAHSVIGEGIVYYKGERMIAAKAFKNEQLNALNITLREGIALINGTSAMTGLAAINLHHSKIALDWMVIFSAMINEIVSAFDDHFSVELNGAKKHSGQLHIAAQVREIIKDSQLIRNRDKHWHNERADEFFKEKVQEYYSIRCVPQILGPIYDTLLEASKIVTDELNSASDNPITDLATENVYHGGNFHGDYISLEMDKIKLVMTKLSMLSERQLNYLLNHKLNKKLPSFLNLRTLGLNFGMQAMQFTATSTTSENQTLSTSSYIHSIPSNHDNQDIVSMGFNSANLAKKVIDNTFEVITIEAVAVLQAIDALHIDSKLSTAGQKIYTELRKIFPVILEDRIVQEEQQKLKEFLIVTHPKLIIK